MKIELRAFWAVIPMVFSNCFNDSGIVDTSNKDNIKPLAKFHGRAYNEGDTTLPSNRLLELANPTIAVVYHYLGARENIRTITKGVVATSPPFQFDIELKQAPPASIQNDDEVSVGLFWLFSDRDSNGSFDRGIHPEYAKNLSIIDSLTKKYYQLNDSLTSLSNYFDEGKATEETTLVGNQGLTLIKNGSKLDTVWPEMPGFSSTATDAPFTRYRVLLAQNKWEKFFDLRKRSNTYSFTTLQNPDYSLEMVLKYNQRLFPKAGKENDFKQKVIDIGLLSTKKNALASKFQYQAFKNGWLDYPYSGFNEPGADWGAGRSRDQFLFFFPTWKSIEVMKKAAETSSFKIANSDKIVPGYNLMECNDQYDCNRLDDNAEIKIYLGKDEMYFNPPSVIKSFAIPASIPENKGKIPEIEGIYEFQPNSDFVVQKEGDDYWIDAGNFGVTKIKAIDSVKWYGAGLPFKIEFVLNNKKEVEKIIMDWNGGRYVAKKTALITAENKSGKIKSQIPLKIEDLSQEIFENLKQSTRWFGTDTLNFSEVTQNSLLLKTKNIPQQKLICIDSNTLISTVGDLRLEWRKESKNSMSELFLLIAGEKFKVPPVNQKKAAPEIDSSQFSNNILIQDERGSGLETFRDYQGKPRFNCTEDSRFLVNGDGGFTRDLPIERTDKITLEANSQFEIKYQADTSSDSVVLSLDFCTELNANIKQSLIRVLWTPNKQTNWTELVSSSWLTPNKYGGASYSITLDKSKNESGYIKVENIGLPGGTLLLALNRYRIYKK